LKTQQKEKIVKGGGEIEPLSLKAKPNVVLQVKKRRTVMKHYRKGNKTRIAFL